MDAGMFCEHWGKLHDVITIKGSEQAKHEDVALTTV